MIFALLLVTATFRPAAPAVGDLITIDFQKPVVLERSENYEIVSQQGSRVVVRTFRPKPFDLAGQTDATRFKGLTIPVRSVLAPDDRLEPAPLKPPVAPPRSRRPLAAIAIAALTAAVLWGAAILLARRASRKLYVAPPVPAAERFRLTVAALRDDMRSTNRWAALADAARAYLAEEYPDLGAELTTTEILPRFRAGEGAGLILAEILGMGDLEKFSPWGAPPRDFSSAADRALSLIPPPPVLTEEVAA